LSDERAIAAAVWRCRRFCNWRGAWFGSAAVAVDGTFNRASVRITLVTAALVADKLVRGGGLSAGTFCGSRAAFYATTDVRADLCLLPLPRCIPRAGDNSLLLRFPGHRASTNRQMAPTLRTGRHRWTISSHPSARRCSRYDMRCDEHSDGSTAGGTVLLRTLHVSGVRGWF